jgi:hypothetical protein
MGTQPNRIAQAPNKVSPSGKYITQRNAFVPYDINISGTFGKRLRVVSGQFDKMFAAIAGIATGLSSNGSIEGVLSDSMMKQNFDPMKANLLGMKMKTGYGCCKLLEAICNLDGDLDNYGKPYKLFLYNHAFGEDFLVTVNNFSISQSDNSSTIWNYSLKLTALSPLKYVVKAERARRMRIVNLASGQVQKSADSVYRVAKEVLGDYVTGRNKINQRKLGKALGNSINTRQ